MLTSAYVRSDKARLDSGEPPQTNVGKLFYLAGWGFDIIRDQAEKVRLWDDIDKMKGTALDRYGAGYGVPRGETSDEIFRIMIKVKIIAMLAAGNLDTVILSAASLFGVRAEDVRADEVYPAKIYLYIDEDKIDDQHKSVAEIIAGLINRIKASGVGIRIFYRTYHSSRGVLHIAAPTTAMVRIKAGVDYSNQERKLSGNIKAGVPALVCVRVRF